MLLGEYAQGLKGVERSNREEALKREITRRVARGESLDGLLVHISGLLVEACRRRRNLRPLKPLKLRAVTALQVMGFPLLGQGLFKKPLSPPPTPVAWSKIFCPFGFSARIPHTHRPRL
jgi:hypothetical protein